MPEGPSIVILREEAARFTGQIVESVAGNSRLDLTRMRGERVQALRSWGKHFLICFDGFAMRVHFMLFGSYRVNERRDAPPRLRLEFDRGEISFYACSLKYIEGSLDAVYDWSADVMAPGWNPRAAHRKLQARPDALACDILLDQDVFAGCGNIIKNEVLHRIRVHPESAVGAPAAQARRVGAPGPRLQFRFLCVEEGTRAAQALAGACQDALSARRDTTGVQGETGPPAAPRVLVRALPAAVSLRCVSLL